MSRMVGTVSRGLRAPIIRQGDNLVDIVTNSVLEASADDGFKVRDRDVVAMTEAIVARAQGNYASVDDIADDVNPADSGVIEDIAACKSAGITTIMITGDNLSTAVTVAKKIGIMSEGTEAISGEMLHEMSDEELIKREPRFPEASFTPTMFSCLASSR